MKPFHSALHIITHFIVLSVFAHHSHAQTTGTWGDQDDGTFRNPVLESNYPDNDVMRVGDTFYMMSSTMHFVPGMMILKSKDLVNWEFSNNVLPALITYSPEYFLKDKRSMESRGTWAGSLGYNGEHYFCYWSFNTIHLSKEQRRNKSHLSHWYAKSKSMEGPWSEPRQITWPNGDPIGHTDPGIFFDLDKKEAWLGFGSHAHRISWDGDRMLHPENEGVLITEDMRGEAAKIYQMDGWYYYMNAHWRVHDGVRQRMSVFHRARSMEGPWEGKLVLENGNGTDRSPSQGSLLKLDDGSYWFIHQLARGEPDVRYNGRPQFLEPVKWIDGWPLIGEDTDGDGIGEVVWHHEKPIKGHPITAPATDDDFNSPKLGLQWNWRFNPQLDRISLSERPGFLRLKSTKRLSKGHPESLEQLPNLIGQRSIGRHDNAITTKYSLQGMVDGQEAGFHISASENNAIGVKQDDDGKRSLFFKHGNPNKPQLVQGNVIEQDEVWFRATIENGLANFFYSLDGKRFQPLGPEVRLLFANFTTNMLGFYSMHSAEKGHLDVDWLTYEYDGPKAAKVPIR